VLKPIVTFEVDGRALRLAGKTGVLGLWLERMLKDAEIGRETDRDELIRVEADEMGRYLFRDREELRRFMERMIVEFSWGRRQEVGAGGYAATVDLGPENVREVAEEVLGMGEGRRLGVLVMPPAAGWRAALYLLDETHHDEEGELLIHCWLWREGERRRIEWKVSREFEEALDARRRKALFCYGVAGAGIAAAVFVWVVTAISHVIWAMEARVVAGIAALGWAILWCGLGLSLRGGRRLRRLIAEHIEKEGQSSATSTS